jgi:hypothetical protein
MQKQQGNPISRAKLDASASLLQQKRKAVVSLIEQRKNIPGNGGKTDNTSPMGGLDNPSPMGRRDSQRESQNGTPRDDNPGTIPLGDLLEAMGKVAGKETQHSDSLTIDSPYTARKTCSTAAS